MTSQDDQCFLDPDLVIAAYCNAYFPMADPNTGVISWYSPDPRAIIPFSTFKVSRSLRRFVQRRIFDVRINTAFPELIRACAQREETWISGAIIKAYTALHTRGIAHSIEAWQDRELVGGLYGVALGGAFFGESMFNKATNASKVALVHLVELLERCGFSLLDTQFMNTHIEQFGAVEIPRSTYLKELSAALSLRTRFHDSPDRCYRQRVLFADSVQSSRSHTK